ncbi:MAG: MipA/OmpV family protein [Gammaproteobacteria bacterium]|nr:MipA/OmpV family protein [Gammaproteobacteria bacterium]
MMKPRILSLLIYVCCACHPYANAQTANEKNPLGPWYLADKPASSWYFDVFAGVEFEPTYAGSDKTVVEPDADFRAIYKTEAGHRYSLSLGEFGGVFQLSDDLIFSAFLEFEEGREDEEDDTLTGLDEVDSTVEGQFSIFKRWGNTFIAGVFQPDLLNRGKGLVYFAALGHDWALASNKLRVSTAFDVSFADGEHMRTEFGITPEESARTGLAPYRPGGGLKSTTASVGLEYSLKKRWSFITELELEYYFDKAADSPLIRDEGSELTYEFFAAARYSF